MKIRWTAWVLCACMLLGMSSCAALSEAEEQAKAEALVEVEYKKSDLEYEWDADEAVHIVLSGNRAQVNGKGAALLGSVLLIDEEGDYLLSGQLNGRILIDAGKNDKIRLILNGLTISSSDSAAVFALKADKVTITLAENTENTVISGGNLLTEDDEALDAAIYSKTDLVINGEGSLTVSSPKGHGILSKDDLRLISGSLAVDAYEDGVRGRDAVQICGGTLNVTANGDGIKSNNDEDEDKGYVSIDGGTLNISAGEDGIQAETALQIRGGEVNVFKSLEGLEAQYMLLSGGIISVAAEDDGLNAAGGDDNAASKGRYFSGGHQSLKISGGVVNINANGDGIDSNGTIEFTGGEIYVSGPVSNGNGALDSDSLMTLTGGVLLAAGSSGMASAPTSDNQAVTLIISDAYQGGGQRVSIRNSSGEELAAFTPDKDWSSIVISVPTLQAGEAFEIYVGDALMRSAVAGESDSRGGRNMGGWNPGGKGRR